MNELYKRFLQIWKICTPFYLKCKICISSIYVPFCGLASRHFVFRPLPLITMKLSLWVADSLKLSKWAQFSSYSNCYSRYGSDMQILRVDTEISGFEIISPGHLWVSHFSGSENFYTITILMFWAEFSVKMKVYSWLKTANFKKSHRSAAKERKWRLKIIHR